MKNLKQFIEKHKAFGIYSLGALLVIISIVGYSACTGIGIKPWKKWDLYEHIRVNNNVWVDGLCIDTSLVGTSEWRGNENFSTFDSYCDTLVKAGIEDGSCIVATAVAEEKCGVGVAISVHCVTDTAFISMTPADTANCAEYNWIWIR